MESLNLHTSTLQHFETIYTYSHDLTCISYYNKLDEAKALMCESLASVSSLMHSNEFSLRRRSSR